MNEYRSLVTKYYLYSITTSTGFVTPVIIAYILESGISYTQLGILSVAFASFWVLGEIPTGYFSDIVGRRESMAVGSGCVILAMLGFGFSSSFLMFAACYAVWGLGIAFKSGSTSAWLYDTLKKHLSEDRYAKVNGRGKSAAFATTAVTAIIGSYVATIWWPLPFMAAAVLTCISLLIILSLPRSRDATSADGGRDSFVTVLQIGRRELYTAKIMPLLVGVVLFLGSLEAGTEYIQPISLQIGISIEQLGWLYAALSTCSAIAGWYVGKVKSYFGTGPWFLFASAMLLVTATTILYKPKFAIVLFFVMKITYTLSVPIKGQLINDHLPSEYRATLVSGVWMGIIVIGAFLSVVMGLVADLIGPILATGLLLVVSSAFLIGLSLIDRL